MAKKECPECGNPAEPGAEACAECGAELAKPRPVAKKPLTDGAKYGIIIGSIVVGLIVLVVLASAMGGTNFKCGDCKGKGTWACSNCKGGTIEPKCVACKGTGQNQATYSTCEVCNGKRTVSPCPKCKGDSTGKCKTCGGSGVTTK